MLESLIALWKAQGWGFEEAHLFMATSPSHNKREGPGEIGVFNDWLCLVHTFSLHKTLNDTLKNHEARNIEEGNVML